MLLLAGVTVFAVLWFAGIIDVRRRSSDNVPNRAGRQMPSEPEGGCWFCMACDRSGNTPFMRGAISSEEPMRNLWTSTYSPKSQTHWFSRQHAAITCKNGAWNIEDLSSSNGTDAQRKPRSLARNDRCRAVTSSRSVRCNSRC